MAGCKGRTSRSTPPWLRSKGAPGASAGAILAKIKLDGAQQSSSSAYLCEFMITARRFMYFTGTSDFAAQYPCVAHQIAQIAFMTELLVPLERRVASRVMDGRDECELSADVTARSLATAVLAEIF
jgi:hypothetical protein